MKHVSSFQLYCFTNYSITKAGILSATLSILNSRSVIFNFIFINSFGSFPQIIQNLKQGGCVYFEPAIFLQ